MPLANMVEETTSTENNVEEIMHPKHLSSWMNPILADLEKENVSEEIIKKDETFGCRLYPLMNVLPSDITKKINMAKKYYAENLQEIYDMPFDGMGSKCELVLLWAGKVTDGNIEILPIVSDTFTEQWKGQIKSPKFSPIILISKGNFFSLTFQVKHSVSKFWEMEVDIRNKDINNVVTIRSEMPTEEKLHHDQLNRVALYVMKDIPFTLIEHILPHNLQSKENGWFVSHAPIILFVSENGYSDKALSTQGKDLLSIYNKMITIGDGPNHQRLQNMLNLNRKGENVA